ncbi:carbon-nitrogen hydrolase family protein [Calidifontibacter indicus]|uniref:Putative amidohydrolase n=1 Tax=Calidifontibacter indicus TaxID=419650 RepID=A0A3D9UZG9_9MICO|nr:carbon-nitrogen hydrolase family protein [Calidifontibacter indicus]REF30211.1 putative amidohydrolase [Calidifontibacter indicus]
MGPHVAVAQFGGSTDKAANRAAVRELVAQAAATGAELVVLPEYSMYAVQDPKVDYRDQLEPVDGEFGSLVSALAKEHSVAIVAGMTVVDEQSDKGINTLLVVGADGELIDTYEKVHLYDAFGFRESDRLRAGDPRAVTFELGGMTFGTMTCYDLRFPEMARLLVDAGADALIVPAAWVVGSAKEDHWTTLLRARAIENTVYVVASGQTGPQCTGLSMVVDPMGVVVANAGEAKGVASAVLDPERVASVRKRNPSLANRRFTVAPK